MSVPVQVEGSAPLQTLRVRMAARAVRARWTAATAGACCCWWRPTTSGWSCPGDLNTSGDGPVVQPGDQLTVLIGGDETLQEATAADQRARATGSSRVSLPELPQRIPVPLSATTAGWRAEIELPDETRLIRVLVADVDYLGSRSVEARADSGVLLLATRSDALERAAAARRDQQWSDFLRALDRGVGRISIFDSAGQLLAQRGEVLLAPPPAQDRLAGVARLLLSLAVRIDPEDRLRRLGDAMSPLATALAGVPGAVRRTRSAPDAGMPVWMLGTRASGLDRRIASPARCCWRTARSRGCRWRSARSSGSRCWWRLRSPRRCWRCWRSRASRSRGSCGCGAQPRRRSTPTGGCAARCRAFGCSDEVDAMAASYNRLLGRLHEHQDYLARLRSRLVHELRTPIMVVRSSLDNLAAEPDPQRTAAYAQRAQAGAARLERIVASMGEASSLEAMLEDSEMEAVDLVALVGACLEGYRTAYPGVRLRLDARVAAAPCQVAPEAIAQALDKLVGNAVDFATPGSEIVVGVGAARVGRRRATGASPWPTTGRRCRPRWPTACSSRWSRCGRASAGTADSRGHLGLGLYLVRLIAEFHGGSAYARNVDGGVEVGFTVGRRLTASHHYHRQRCPVGCADSATKPVFLHGLVAAGPLVPP